MTDEFCETHDWVPVGAYNRDLDVSDEFNDTPKCGLMYLCQGCSAWTTFEPDPDDYVDPEALTE